jgi:hypothetical protein
LPGASYFGPTSASAARSRPDAGTIRAAETVGATRASDPFAARCWLTVRGHTGGVGDDPAAGGETAEIFDDELTRVLQEHGLQEQSRALLTTGAASIAVPGMMLHARLRIPRRWRKGLLEVTTEDSASGAVLGTSSSPLSRGGRSHGSLSLIDEITIQLALEVAHGPSAQVKDGRG